MSSAHQDLPEIHCRSVLFTKSRLTSLMSPGWAGLVSCRQRSSMYGGGRSELQ